jgi:rSAM/selenodomain-associated transferase 2
MPWCSVIVPTLDEAAEIEGTLAAARRALGTDGVEWIVADGGSRDDTRARAGRWARVVDAPRGRGPQLNAGARSAQGEILVFLHADTHLPEGARAALERALEDPRVVGGHFRFGLRGPVARSRAGQMLQAGINLRCALFGSATGDQAMFCRRAAFDALGGFAPLPLFEDLDFYRRLKRLGRVVRLPLAVATSDRRWRTRGVLRTACLHGALRAAYHLGADPRRLAARYRRD